MLALVALVAPPRVPVQSLSMRAVRSHELTGPQALRVDEVPDPAPEAGEVLIEVRAAGVNFPDVLLSYGKYQFKPAPPFVPGGEAAGVVRSVGPGVRAVSPGDRVCTTLVHGAFAELIVVPEASVVKLPATVSFETGAATLLTYATTLHALSDRASLRSVDYDPVGGPYADAALRSIPWEGRYLVVGFAAGEIPKVPLSLGALEVRRSARRPRAPRAPRGKGQARARTVSVRRPPFTGVRARARGATLCAVFARRD